MKENYNKKYSYTKIIIIWQPQKMWAGNFKFEPDRIGIIESTATIHGRSKGEYEGGGRGGGWGNIPFTKNIKKKNYKKKVVNKSSILT